MGIDSPKPKTTPNPFSFENTWRNGPALPRADLTAKDLLRDLQGGVESRADLLEYVLDVRDNYAWSPGMCGAAKAHLDLLNETLRSAEKLNRVSHRIWQGTLGISAALFAYAGVKATQGNSFGNREWAALVTPVPLVVVSSFAKFITNKLSKEFESDIKKLKYDIDWRCMDFPLFLHAIDLENAREPGAPKGVNFEVTPLRKIWTRMDSGAAEPSYLIDGAIIGALTGGAIVEGGVWVWEEIVSALAPSLSPLGGTFSAYWVNSN